MAITSLTRNQVVGQPARGFESHRLRFLKKPVKQRQTLILQAFFDVFHMVKNAEIS